MKLREISFSLSTNLFLINLCIFKLTLKKIEKSYLRSLEDEKIFRFIYFRFSQSNERTIFAKLTSEAKQHFSLGYKF